MPGSPRSDAAPAGVVFLSGFGHLETVEGATNGALGARGLFAEAVAGFDEAEMPIQREATRARLGLCGEPDALPRALAWLSQQGVVQPEQLIDVFAPPCPVSSG